MENSMNTSSFPMEFLKKKNGRKHNERGFIMAIARDFFIFLSKNEFLNKSAKRWGLRLGAQKVVAGTNLEELLKSVRKLNDIGISCTIDNLGEFVEQKEEALNAKNQILNVIEAIHNHKLDAHISLKPSQLGLDIDYHFALENLQEIVERAKKYDIFINFDMEDYPRLDDSFRLIDHFSKDFDNVGTVIQAYFFRAKDDIKKYKNLRLRIVKGAYKESPSVAYQNKEDIDRNYIELIEWHLLNGKFTSIATHDHHVINHVKKFVEEHGISKDKFEFQMLYGFREELQIELVNQGYQFCTYVPFGEDWYGYFMRRLAERPQNINLVVNQVLTKRNKQLLGLAATAFVLGRLSKKAK